MNGQGFTHRARSERNRTRRVGLGATASLLAPALCLGVIATPASAQFSGVNCNQSAPCALKTKQMQVCRADYDNDGVVDIDDLNLLLAAIGQPHGPTRQQILDLDIDGLAGVGCIGRLDQDDVDLLTAALGEVCLCDGDVNGSGETNEKDAEFILEVLGDYASSSCQAEFADLNNNGVVDLADLDMMLNAWGCGGTDPCQGAYSNCSQPGSVPHACKADYDHDGVVDQDDLDILLGVLAQPGGPTLQDVLDYDIDSNTSIGCPGVLDIEDVYLLQRAMGVECPCGGADLSGDGIVNETDASFVMILLGSAANDGFCKAEFFDIDNSGFVDYGDLAEILRPWGCGGTDPCILPCVQPEQVEILACRADYDHDGVVDQDDLDILDAALNQPGGPTESDIRSYDIDANSFSDQGDCPGVLDLKDRYYVLYLMGIGATCPCYGDLDGSGVVDTTDVFFVNILQGATGNFGFCKAEFFDLDNSGFVDQGDFDILFANYGCGSADPCATDQNCIQPGSVYNACRADYDGDGVVDQDDVLTLTSIIFSGTPPTLQEIYLYDLDAGANCPGVLDGEDLILLLEVLGQPCHCQGDANGDGVVDQADIDFITFVWGLGYNDGCKPELGDLNNDGIVDGLDLNIVLANFGCSG